jgi:hypothetical protein
MNTIQPTFIIQTTVLDFHKYGHESSHRTDDPRRIAVSHDIIRQVFCHDGPCANHAFLAYSDPRQSYSSRTYHGACTNAHCSGKPHPWAQVTVCFHPTIMID